MKDKRNYITDDIHYFVLVIIYVALVLLSVSSGFGSHCNIYLFASSYIVSIELRRYI